MVTEPYLGNKTESALLILANKVFNQFATDNLETQRSANHDKIVQIIQFESSRKWAGIVMKIDNGFRLYARERLKLFSRIVGT